jgi:hypothetical protein
MSLNDELKCGRERSLTIFDALFQHCTGVTEENNNPVYPLSGPELNLGIPECEANS